MADADEAAACQHQLFESQARRSPDATAVAFSRSSLTYAELDLRANRLAWHLQDLGVGPDVRVGVCLDRSLDLAMALLAVLKAGGGCVPLDPSYPRERLAFMVGDAGLPVVLTSAALVQRLPADGVGHVLLDGDSAEWSTRPVAPPPSQVGPDHVAYVIYTSGSTGRPKGVLLTHRGLVNHHRVAAELYGLGPGDRALQFCSIGFDASIEEIFPTWAAGATVVFRTDEVPILGRGWLAWLASERISVLNLPTAYWHEWGRDLERLGEVVPGDVRLVVVGGEKAQGAALRTWLGVGGDRARWVNAYGPTEATCMTTVYEHPPGTTAEGGDPPIGRPLPHTTAHVVDEQGRPAGTGAVGELMIGGLGLARGYLNHPELTADRFVAGTAAEGGRRYRTGDLVRMLPSGDLEYVGRMDGQVKIQGFRVECGEVEAALVGHPAVGDAVVVARQDPPGDRRLVAYVVAGGAAPAAPALELRRFLAERLPAHMVPSAFVDLDAFPLTANGKVDRAGLPAPDAVTASRRPRPDRDLIAARSPAEARLAAIWAAVLGVPADEISVDDDFFELGGHSLLATQVIARVREEFGTDTPLRAIFEAPTVAGLAALVSTEEVSAAPTPPLAPGPRPPGARFPLSMAQEQMLALELAAEPPGLYNVTALHRFDRLDDGALRAALRGMVDRHETLRTAVVVEAGRAAQVVLPALSFELETTDLSHLPGPERAAELRRVTAMQDVAPFDLARAPLFRARVVRLDADVSELAVTFDHLICDGTSAEVFMTELAETYAALAEGRAPDLPPIEVQFADFAAWQRGWLTDEVLQAQVAWWTTALDGVPLGPAVPFDHVPAAPSRRIASRTFTVPPATYQRLQGLARTSQSSVFVVCAAAVLAVLSRHGGMTDVVVSTTLSGRLRVELEGLISMFAGVGRIRTDLGGDPPFTEIVARARTSVLGMFEHQDVPFMRVRRAVLPDFPTDGVAVACALPVELGYFRAASAEPAAKLFFRGQLHPLSITLHDDGSSLRGEISHKLDFYDQHTINRLAESLIDVLYAVSKTPWLTLSELPVSSRPGL